MGFDLFFQPLVNGEVLDIGTAELRSLFPVVDEESKPDYWSIRYDSLNACHIGVKAFASSANQLASFYVERPCGDPRFWEALLHVLKKGRIVLYFPGGPPVVASENAAAALPGDVTRAIGEPRCVGSAEEILKILRES
jgi:hypothetical protein